MDKVKPFCPECRGTDLAASFTDARIFCQCGAEFKNDMELWLKMKRQIQAKRWRKIKKRA